MTERQSKWRDAAFHLSQVAAELIHAIHAWPADGEKELREHLVAESQFIEHCYQTATFLSAHIEISEDGAEITAAESQIVKEDGQA